MPGTASSSNNNAWIAYISKCAKTFLEEQSLKPNSPKAPHKPKDKAGHDGHDGNDQAKEQAQIKEWKNRQEEVYRKSSHANMRRSNEIAQKAEGEHVARKPRADKKADRSI